MEKKAAEEGVVLAVTDDLSRSLLGHGVRGAMEQGSQLSLCFNKLRRAGGAAMLVLTPTAARTQLIFLILPGFPGQLFS